MKQRSEERKMNKIGRKERRKGRKGRKERKEGKEGRKERKDRKRKKRPPLHFGDAIVSGEEARAKLLVLLHQIPKTS